MSSHSPEFTSVSRRRRSVSHLAFLRIELTHSRLMSLYNNLHASVHAKNTHIRVHHCISRSSSSLAWVTPKFELYCVAEPNANRNALVQSATKVAQWVQQEENRLFIIGGAVCILLLCFCLHLLTLTDSVRRPSDPDVLYTLFHIPHLASILHRSFG